MNEMIHHEENIKYQYHKNDKFYFWSMYCKRYKLIILKKKNRNQ